MDEIDLGTVWMVEMAGPLGPYDRSLRTVKEWKKAGELIIETAYRAYTRACSLAIARRWYNPYSIDGTYESREFYSPDPQYRAFLVSCILREHSCYERAPRRMVVGTCVVFVEVKIPPRMGEKG